MCSSEKYVLSLTWVMITLRRSAPSPTMTCFKRSCVRGREQITPASSIAIALASAGPIQIGSTRSPSCSCRITTGVLVVRSRPRWATRTWITSRLGTQVPGGEILALRRREGVDRDAHRLELEPRDLAVQLPGDPVHVLGELLGLADDVLRGERLVRERHVHYARGMPFRRRQVDQAPVGQDEDALPVEPPFLHELPDPDRPLGDPLQAVQIDFDVEMARVRQHGAVLHGPHV